MMRSMVPLIVLVFEVVSADGFGGLPGVVELPQQELDSQMRRTHCPESTEVGVAES